MQTYLPSIRSDNAHASAAQQFAAWWLYRLGNKRTRMIEDARLTQCAQAHAHYGVGNAGPYYVVVSAPRE